MAVNVGMVFALIFALILIGVILVFGMQQIWGIFTLGGQAQVNKAVLDLEKLVEDVYVMSPGTSQIFELNIPEESKICFINTSEKPCYGSTARGCPQTYTVDKKWKWWDPERFVVTQMINNSNSPYYMSNVWIYYTKEGVGEGYKIENLATKKSFCTKTGLKLYLENAGYYVEISVL